jgi:aconitate hydratase
VVGFELTGELPPGATATDLVLTIVEILRNEGVVGKFVEYFGAGVSRMSLADRATIASYERIHRSNLVGMGVLPLEFSDGQTWQSIGLTGEEQFDIEGFDDNLEPRSTLTVKATSADGDVKQFEARVRIDTPVETEYYRNGGILQTVLRKLLAS